MKAGCLVVMVDGCRDEKPDVLDKESVVSGVVGCLVGTGTLEEMSNSDT